MFPVYFAVPAPDFTSALVPALAPASGAAPDVTPRIKALAAAPDRVALLRGARGLLMDLLCVAECPDDFLRIARLIGSVEAELREMAIAPAA